MSTTVSPTGTISVPVTPSDPSAAEPLPEKKKTEPRTYVVLRKHVGESPSAAQSWEFLRNVDATSTEQAVRRAAEILLAAGEEEAITLVAVVATRFAPVTVTAEVKTQLKLN